MSGMRAAVLGKGLAVALAATGTLATAATKPIDPLVLPDDIADLKIEDLTVKDPLGFNCIQEKHIDLAFHATGKGMRMPRTCLPEPCVKALTPFRLAALIGRTPSEGEWGQYFARYADFCRKEVVPFEAIGPEGLGDGGVRPEAAFWLPLLAGFGDGDPRGPSGTAPTGGGGGPVGGGGGPIIIGGGGGTPGGGGGVLPDGGGGVQPVPLPAPIWLMLAAVLGLRAVRGRRARPSA